MLPGPELPLIRSKFDIQGGLKIVIDSLNGLSYSFSVPNKNSKFTREKPQPYGNIVATGPNRTISPLLSPSKNPLSST